MMRRIYLASSWRNPHYEAALHRFLIHGHDVYDFKHPGPTLCGFGWQQTLAKPVDQWSPPDLLEALDHPVARRGFLADFSAMKWCDTMVLLLPCGRSAHLEAGWAAGQGKNLHVVLHEEKFEPELMYLMADAIHLTIDDCLESINA